MLAWPGSFWTYLGWTLQESSKVAQIVEADGPG